MARPDSVGRPLPTIDVEIRDADGKPVPEGAEGEICLRGPLVMREYWRRPRGDRRGDRARVAGCAPATSAGWRTAISTSTRVGRDLILRGAENVYPAEIEQALEAHDAVREAAVVGVDHAELGQEVKAIVVVGRSAG